MDSSSSASLASAGDTPNRVADDGFSRALMLARAGVIAALAGVVAFLCLRPSPNVSDWSWVPAGIARWIDGHGVWRNTAAFGAVAGIVGLLVPRRRRREALAAVAGFAALTEVMQVWIPTRVFDPLDIAAAWLGVVAAAGALRLGGGREKHRSRGPSR